MTKRPPTPTADWDTLFPMLIARWRKLMKLPIGPADQLQTREFRTLIEHISLFQEQPRFDSTESFGAYLMYQWPLHYAQALSLIKELPQKPLRVLDVGAGSAPFSLAALQYGAKEVFALDHDERALKYGADLCGHLGYPISVRTCDCTQIRQWPVEGRWDLIILGYSLFEMFDSSADQVAYIQKLLPMLSETGYILLVEDSASEINRRFLGLRDEIALKNIPIQAPCLWKGNCPALRHGASPCFAQRPFEKPFMIKEIQRAANINLSSLKMSYLILKSPAAQNSPMKDTMYRVVSPSVKTFRGMRYFLCGVKGKRTLGSSLAEHPKHSKAFEFLKRGDVISVEQALETEDDFQITKDTKILIEAPFDKPLS
jgi:predicted nicotinamide N-methyase